MTTIPASELVQVTPNVLPAGGDVLDMTGLMLTTSLRPPIGSILSLPTAAAVEAYFGAVSAEAVQAAIYFAGFDNSSVKPGAILYAQYPTVAVAAWLRGGNASGLTLANLQAISGTVIITADGSTHAGTINLSSALSFSAAAALIQTALDATVNFTATIDPNVVTGHIDPNAFTASITGTTMTVSAAVSGTVLGAGQTVSGSSVAAGTTIVAQLTGTAGSTGTYQLSISQAVSSESMTASGSGMTVSAVTTGKLAVGQTVTGAGVTAGTTILGLGTGTGGTGTYFVDKAQTVGSETLTGSGGYLNVSAVSAGTLAVGDVIAGAGVTLGNHITAAITGTGGTGTYFVSVGDSVGSEAMTVSGAGVVVTYDSVSGGFLITSGTTGANSTMSYATGTASAALLLTSVLGATLSQGAAAASPAAFMDSITAISTDWASFTHLFNPDASGNDARYAFAVWNGQQDDRFLYVPWDADLSPTTSNNATTSLGNRIKAADVSGSAVVFSPDASKASFACGALASIDFNEVAGRITFAYKGQSGLTPDVTTAAAARNLIANGYNFYGAYATANQSFILFQPGSVSGPFRWMDTYVDQIYFNAQFQLSLMVFLATMKSVPFNPAGYASVEAALSDPIAQMLSFGAAVPNVPLSGTQVAAVNAAAGLKIAPTISAQGYYLQVQAASPQVRQARGPLVVKFWYTDGESIQTIDLTSITVL